jgi:ketosteroid isomerase-like protein
MLTHADAVALFDRRRLAWLHEDLDGYLALWADEMTFGSPVHPEPLLGKPAFADLVRRSNAMSKPRRFDVTHLAVHGDMVLAEWSIAMTHRETGRVIAWDGMSVAEIVDGRITVWREYWNPAALA